MSISGYARQTRHLADTRFGFIISSDRVNLQLSDHDERSSKFNIALNLCLIWWRIEVIIYF